MAFTELNDVPSKVNYGPVILRRSPRRPTKNLPVKAQEQQMLRCAQHDRTLGTFTSVGGPKAHVTLSMTGRDLHVDWWE
jgi:hypothetical protein